MSSLLQLLPSSGRKWTKHLSEYFALLLDFAAMGAEEKRFLNSVDTVSALAAFYLGHKAEAGAKAANASVQVFPASLQMKGFSFFFFRFPGQIPDSLFLLSPFSSLFPPSTPSSNRTEL